MQEQPIDYLVFEDVIWKWRPEKSGAAVRRPGRQLKQQKFIVPQFWRLEVQDQGVGRVGFFSGLLFGL